jgi:catechol 2,3-dioxygenase
MNSETIIHPKLQHVGLTTGRLQPMLGWYETVLGMRLIYLLENPTGDTVGSSLKAAWLSNDEANPRVAVIEIPGLTGGS